VVATALADERTVFVVQEEQRFQLPAGEPAE
jgi:hypothetical protein